MSSTRLRGMEVTAARASTQPWLPFVVAGAGCVLAGGFVAAAGGEAPSRHLSWACAYLVLVCGSAQILLGGGRAFVRTGAPRRAIVTWQLLTFNLGNAGVLVGTLAVVPIILYTGSALMVSALGMFAWDTRGERGHPGKLLVVYRLGIIALAVSVPVGAVLGR